jgi:hypothetical protein
VTGTVEYLLRVEAADLPSYKRFHTDILGAAAGGDDHDLCGDGFAQGRARVSDRSERPLQAKKWR